MAASTYIFIEQTILFIYIKYLKFHLSILTNTKFKISNTAKQYLALNKYSFDFFY